MRLLDSVPIPTHAPMLHATTMTDDESSVSLLPEPITLHPDITILAAEDYDGDFDFDLDLEDDDDAEEDDDADEDDDDEEDDDDDDEDEILSEDDDDE